jgi:Domain of unknown function (DUF4806)
VSNPEFRYIAYKLAQFDIFMKEFMLEHNGEQILKSHGIELPIKMIGELDRVESLITDRQVAFALRKMFITLKPGKKSRPSDVGLAKILDDDLLITFNWKGVMGKGALKHYELFSRILFGMTLTFSLFF